MKLEAKRPRFKKKNRMKNGIFSGIKAALWLLLFKGTEKKENVIENNFFKQIPGFVINIIIYAHTIQHPDNCTVNDMRIALVCVASVNVTLFTSIQWFFFVSFARFWINKDTKFTFEFHPNFSHTCPKSCVWLFDAVALGQQQQQNHWIRETLKF